MSTNTQQITAFIQLRHQILNGCNGFKCTTKDCRSNPSFSHTDLTEENIDAYLKTHHELSFCRHVPPSVLRPEVLIKAQVFDATILTLLHTEKNLTDPNIYRARIEAVFNDQGAFAYILHGNPTPSSMTIKDSDLYDLIHVLHTHESLFETMTVSFTKLLNSFTKIETYHQLRALFLATLFYPLLCRTAPYEEFCNFLTIIHELDTDISQRFFQLFTDHKCAIRQFLAALQLNIDICLISNQQKLEDPTIITIAKVIGKLQKSSFPTHNAVSPFLFYNRLYTSAFLKLLKTNDIDISDNGFVSTALLGIDCKYFLLKEYFHSIQEDSVRDHIFRSYTLQNVFTPHDLHLELQIQRDRIVEDTIEQISRIDNKRLRLRLVVSFKDEQGIDAGGVSREFFFLLMDKLFAPDYGMFKLVNGCYWFNPHSYDPPMLFTTLGTVVGLAIYNSIILPIRFPTVLYKKIKNITLNLDDIADIDPDLHKGLKSLLEMRESGDDVSDVGQTFTILIESYDTVKEVVLVEGMGDKLVTNENLDQFIDAYVDYKLNKSVETQFNAFKAGFMKLCGNLISNILSPKEFEIIVSGEESLDWEAMKKSTKYSDGYTAESESIKIFWEIFDELSVEKKKSFLLFTTGTARAPVGGLGSLGMTIQRTSDTDKLPVAHTCFNVFSLPDYRSKPKMEHMLKLALANINGFGLI